MHGKKVIAHNLKATKDQIPGDLRGSMLSPLRKMTKEPLLRADELKIHIEHLSDDIASHMKQVEKQSR